MTFSRLTRLLVRRLSYVQGQSPSPKKREYFYFIDHQGQLFLDDAKVKNFITCFKDKKFLAFFFRRIKPNTTDRYQGEFPYISPCGPEINYIRCDDLPIVFTHLLDRDGHVIEDISTYGQTEPDSEGQQEHSRVLGNSNLDLKVTISQELRAQQERGTKRSTERLSYGGAGSSLTQPFQPEKLCMLPDSGRVYHTGPTLLGGVGLVKSSLALEFSRFFVYAAGASESHAPVAFRWRGRTHSLDRSVLDLMGTTET